MFFWNRKKRFDLKIGLVLSGGGAKGAYQAGVFQALADMDVVPRIAAVSGCSIGALNAILFAMEDKELWQKVWNEVSYGRFLARDDSVPRRKFTDIWRDIKEREPSHNLKEFIARNQLAPFSQVGIRSLAEEYADFEKISKFRAPLYVCAYNMEKLEPEYFKLNGRSKEEIMALTMASSAIPVVFNPVVFQGYHYCDGGIAPPYTDANNADKVPLKPLLQEKCDVIIVVYLSHYDKVDRRGFPASTQFIELYPSRPLELVKGAGTLDLSKDTLMEHMIQGYNDMAAVLGPMIVGLLKNRPLEELVEEHQQVNHRLLNRQLPILRAAEEAAAKSKKGVP